MTDIVKCCPLDLKLLLFKKICTPFRSSKRKYPVDVMPMTIIVFYLHQRHFGIFIHMPQMLKVKPTIISNLSALIKLELGLGTHQTCAKIIPYYKL